MTSVHLSEQNVRTSLQSLGFTEDILTHSCAVTLSVQKKVKKEIIEAHNELYGNKNSNHYIKNIEKRMDTERQLIYRMLQENKHYEYFLIDKLPLLLEHCVKALNEEEEVEIGFMLYKDLAREAKQTGISYEELAFELQEK